MKKYILVLFCTIAAVALLSGVRAQSLGERIKRNACEKVCERNYNKCMEGDKDAKTEDGYAKDISDAAKEETCADAKEECIEKCNNM